MRIQAIWMLLLLLSPGAFSSEDAPHQDTVLVEGVASGPQAAPIAALRELDERLEGLSFAVIDGKFVNFEESAPAEQIDTRGKRVVRIDQLQTGLYRAVVEVTLAPGRNYPAPDLRENLIRGEAGIRGPGNLVFARQQARRDACERAVLLTAESLYPASSIPPRLMGKVFFLGTTREWIDEDHYRLLARIKVRITEP